MYANSWSDSSVRSILMNQKGSRRISASSTASPSTADGDQAATAAPWVDADQEVYDLQTALTQKRGGPGLAAAAKAYLGKALDKSQQCSDWDARPLSEAQRAYAALDAGPRLRELSELADAAVAEAIRSAPSAASREADLTRAARKALHGPLMRVRAGEAVLAEDASNDVRAAVAEALATV